MADPLMLDKQPLVWSTFLVCSPTWLTLGLDASQINPPIADNGYDHVGSDKSPDVNPGALVDREEP